MAWARDGDKRLQLISTPVACTSYIISMWALSFTSEIKHIFLVNIEGRQPAVTPYTSVCYARRDLLWRSWALHWNLVIKLFFDLWFLKMFYVYIIAGEDSCLTGKKQIATHNPAIPALGQPSGIISMKLFQRLSSSLRPLCKLLCYIWEKERMHMSRKPATEAGWMEWRPVWSWSWRASTTAGLKCGLKASKAWPSSRLVTMILGTIQTLRKRKARSSSAVT